MEIYLIRHTSVNIDKTICYGQKDVPIQKTWETEAIEILPKLPNECDTIFSSPLSRCAILAQYISKNKYNTKNIILEQQLLEINFGDWEGKKWLEIEKTKLNTWMANFVETEIPNGESFKIFHNRISLFLENLITQNLSKVIIITHSGVIRSIICKILDISLENAFKLEIDYAGITHITHNKYGFKLLKFNY